MKRLLDRPEDWVVSFWDGIDQDDGIQAIRLLGELLADRCIVREGDDVRGTNESRTTWLSPNDQHLLRRIEWAVKQALEQTEEVSR